MKRLLVTFFIGLAGLAQADIQSNSIPAGGTAAPACETIVCIRHGEKPADGLGQLNCRGLNRALALPKVLLAKYGTPQFVFAPNPTPKVDHGVSYNYIRPLMTIEPTAVRCGLPVNTTFGYQEITGLEQELAKPEYQGATIFVAWEHSLLDDFAKNLIKDNGGNPQQVPAWPGNDYDTIFVFKITTENARKMISFSIDHEGLNGLSDDCP